MRDPKRIKTVLNLMEKIWDRHPDQRLGQLLSNYCFGHHVDPWHQEDDDTITIMKKILKIGEAVPGDWKGEENGSEKTTKKRTRSTIVSRNVSPKPGVCSVGRKK